MACCCSRKWIFTWGSRAHHHLPESTALDRTYEYSGEVLVIGAGAAGLAAARVLEKNHIRYVILEATDRLGGRLREDTTFADFPLDLGAEWIHNNPSILDVLSGGEQRQQQPELIPYQLDVSTWDGRRLLTQSSWFSRLTYWFFPESKFKRSTWFDFVRRTFAEAGGVQQQIRYDSPVAEVVYSGERVQVKTAGGEEFTADKVLVTASVGVLRSGDIAFSPPLSDRRQAALASVQFLPGFKMLLKFSEKFYPDEVACEEGHADGEKTFYDAAFRKEAQDNVLGFLATGAATEKYYALDTEEQMVAAAVAELEAMFGDVAKRSFSGEYRLVDWGRLPFTKGTWVAGFRVESTALAEINTPLLRGGGGGEPVVHFAGEAHDEHRQLGVPGAALSGLAVVDRMLRPHTS